MLTELKHGHVDQGVSHEVGGNPTQRLSGRVDERVTYHELLKGVVLDGSSNLGKNRQIIGGGRIITPLPSFAVFDPLRH